MSMPVETIDLEKCIQAVLAGKGCADAAGIGQDELEKSYALAHRLYEDELYDRALPLFGRLVLLSPGDMRFSMGTGACYQMLGRFELALQCYAVVASQRLPIRCAWSTLHIACCSWNDIRRRKNAWIC
jgi:tetratricopeptide (TPR) repeat protein